VIGEASSLWSIEGGMLSCNDHILPFEDDSGESKLVAVTRPKTTPRRRGKATKIIEGKTCKQRSHSRVGSFFLLQEALDNIENGENVEEVDVASACVDDDGVNDIFLSMVKFHDKNTIVELDLSFNNISSVGAVVIANALASCESHLHVLNLWGNNLGDEGAESIACALETNSRLETMNLAENAVGNDGTEAIAKALEKNRMLKDLVLFGNKISSTGAASLCDCLEKENGTLIVLDLRFNFIEPLRISDRLVKLVTKRKERFNTISFIVKTSFQVSANVPLAQKIAKEDGFLPVEDDQKRSRP